MMERESAESGHNWAAYGKDEHFDIEVGMAVSDPAGQQIGRVMEVAGFGSTHVQETSHSETADSVTQAQSGTGYFTVDDVPGTNGQGLMVPFHGIQDVTSDHGVNLNGSIIAELYDQAEQTITAAVEVQPIPRSGWHRWLLGRRA